MTASPWVQSKLSNWNIDTVARKKNDFKLNVYDQCTNITCGLVKENSTSYPDVHFVNAIYCFQNIKTTWCELELLFNTTELLYNIYSFFLPSLTEKQTNEQNKPTHGVAGGVAILVILVVAGTAVAVYLVYRKKNNRAPPPGNSFDNSLYFSSSSNAATQDTNILVNNMEQL